MRSAVTLLASIPSPSSGTLDLGPVTIHMYGLMLLAGIAACIFITCKRWVARGGDWDLIFRVAVWGVGAGIVGARLYHLATSWSEVPDEWWGLPPSGRAGSGSGAGSPAASSSAGSSRSGRRAPPRCSTPLLRASSSRRRSAGSATGGTRRSSASRPTAPGVEIDTARRPDEYIFNETFHPTFLYEALWNLGAAALLLILDRRFTFRPPALFALYVSLYTGFRFYLETIRIDPSEELAGLRVNAVGLAAPISRRERSVARPPNGRDREAADSQRARYPSPPPSVAARRWRTGDTRRYANAHAAARSLSMSPGALQ